MVVKVYISGISGNKEVKKRQQRVQLILDSKNVKYDIIDIAEPGSEEQKDFMHSSSTSPGATISDPTPRHPLPPQIFNDEDYCGDYDLFDMANEIDEMEKFLKLAPDDSAPIVTSNAEVKLDNGDAPVTEEEKPEEIQETKNGEVADTKEETEAVVDQKVENNETDDQKIENGSQDEVTDQKDDDETSEKAEDA